MKNIKYCLSVKYLFFKKFSHRETEQLVAQTCLIYKDYLILYSRFIGKVISGDFPLKYNKETYIISINYL